MATTHSTATLSEREAFGWWLTGFSDGESCFNVSVPARIDSRPISAFVITLRGDDAPILHTVRNHLGFGNLHAVPSTRAISLAIPSIDGMNAVEQHFLTMPLQGKKSLDFAIWQEALTLRREVHARHRRGTERKWRTTDFIRFQGFSDRLKHARSYQYNPVVALTVDPQSEAFGHYIAGLTDGEGSFGIYPNGRLRTPRCRFALALRDDNLKLVEAIHQRLGCGTVQIKTSKRSNPIAMLSVNIVSELYNVLAPFFRRFPLRSKKAADFAIWSGALGICHAVASMPRIGNPGGGRAFNWSPATLDQCDGYTKALKEARSYKP